MNAVKGRSTCFVDTRSEHCQNYFTVSCIQNFLQDSGVSMKFQGRINLLWRAFWEHLWTTMRLDVTRLTGKGITQR